MLVAIVQTMCKGTNRASLGRDKTDYFAPDATAFDVGLASSFTRLTKDGIPHNDLRQQNLLLQPERKTKEWQDFMSDFAAVATMRLRQIYREVKPHAPCPAARAIDHRVTFWQVSLETFASAFGDSFSLLMDDKTCADSIFSQISRWAAAVSPWYDEMTKPIGHCDENLWVQSAIGMAMTPTPVANLGMSSFAAITLAKGDDASIYISRAKLFADFTDNRGGIAWRVPHSSHHTRAQTQRC